MHSASVACPEETVISVLRMIALPYLLRDTDEDSLGKRIVSYEGPLWRNKRQSEQELRCLPEHPIGRHMRCAHVHEDTSVVRDVEEFAGQYITRTA